MATINMGALVPKHVNHVVWIDYVGVAVSMIKLDTSARVNPIFIMETFSNIIHILDMAFVIILI